MRIVLADDHVVVRKGLRMVLEAEPDIEVVAEAGSIAEALVKTRAHRPAVLVLDVNMPDGSSLAALPAFLEGSPETGVVVLTMQSEPDFAREALQSGARAYVLKEAADDELVAAIRAVAAGDTYLNPRLGARIASSPPPRPRGPVAELTERERDVLRLIALGHTNAEIAGQLYLSVRTVETHRSHIQRKLGRTTRAELVRCALDNGLVDTG